jgi:hypothetical protein
MKKCFFCGQEKVHEDSVMGFCDECGLKIWGPKMLKTIKENYGKARDEDDLVHMDTSSTLKMLRSGTSAREGLSSKGR